MTWAKPEFCVEPAAEGLPARAVPRRDVVGGDAVDVEEPAARVQLLAVAHVGDLEVEHDQRDRAPDRIAQGA
jgi:hypothetical protein